MSSIRVSELAIYPVKSLAQIQLKKSKIDNFGLQNDRRWMVVDQQGKFITQRQQSRMCLIQAVLLESQASLDDLNSKLDVAVPMKRFRPNLVVNGCNAFDEDNWKRLRVGDLIFRVVKPCSRCVIPSIDTDTGERGSEPTKTLVSYRKKDNKIFFGQNIIADTPGFISVGDLVEIIE